MTPGAYDQFVLIFFVHNISNDNVFIYKVILGHHLFSTASIRITRF